LSAERMPQHHWAYTHNWPEPSISNYGIPGLVVDVSGNLLGVDKFGARILVYDSVGTLLSNFGSGNLGIPSCIAIGPSGRVYVGDQSLDQVIVFEGNGTYVANIGSGFTNIVGIAVDSDEQIYALDNANAQVTAMNAAGVILRTWGQSGSAPGEFNSLKSIAISKNDMIYVGDSYRIQAFDTNGTHLLQFNRGGGGNFFGICLVPDGLIIVGTGPDELAIYNRDGTYLYRLTGSARIPSKSRYQMINIRAVTINPLTGTLYAVECSGGTKISIWKPAYNYYPESVGGSLPFPDVQSVAQRTGTTLVDIDYRVTDADSATVETRVVAFQDGIKTFSNFIPMTDFDGIITNKLGINVPTNQTHTITWNAAADWSTNFGQAKIDILANDGGGIIGYELVTLPDEGSGTLDICRTPLKESHFKEAWLWLLAGSDSDLLLAGGIIYGATGSSYDGQQFTDGVENTTAQGRGFLYDRMNVREATAAEFTRAQEASTPGGINIWYSDVSVKAGEDPNNMYPHQYNQYGIETSAIAGGRYWIIPL